MTNYESPTLCYACGAVVYRLDIHEDWHQSIAKAFEDRDSLIRDAIEGLRKGFEDRDKILEEIVENTGHAFKARDVELGRLVDTLIGRKPRASYKWPQTDEERAEIEAIVRELGIDKDAGE